MELEHTNLGHHCEMESCNQRDFLPFTCDLCRKKLCLLHRSYAAHSCDGSNSRDMTSIDCPICGKSVKFSQAQSVDDVWEKHYFNDCSKVLAPIKATKICFKSTCPTVLGLSNSFRCTKCGHDVCLLHRVPEDHECTSLRGSKGYKENRFNTALLDQLESKKKHPTQNPPSSSRQDKNNSNMNSISLGAGANSLKGSAERRMKNNRMEDTPASDRRGIGQSAEFHFPCTLCNFVAFESTALEAHFSHSHPDNNNGNESSNHSAAQSQSGEAGFGSEICPQCRKHFPDVTSLVAHFETSHARDGNGNGSMESNIPPKNASKKNY